DSMDLVSLNAVIPDDVKKLVADRKAGLIAGTTSVYAGPLVDQSGKVIVPAGKEADIDMMKSMNFYVKGVVGTIPK
ncbi:MAG: BMP family ABC transporter substrate-binding protein, partial [Burkholderiaceae bacterium]